MISIFITIMIAKNEGKINEESIDLDSSIISPNLRSNENSFDASVESPNNSERNNRNLLTDDL